MSLVLDSGPARIVTCRSADLGDDLHRYREVLFSSDGMQELASYRYEIAGLEFLTMPVLTVLLSVVSVFLMLIVRSSWRLWRLLSTG